MASEPSAKNRKGASRCKVAVAPRTLFWTKRCWELGAGSFSSTCVAIGELIINDYVIFVTIYPLFYLRLVAWILFAAGIAIRR